MVNIKKIAKDYLFPVICAIVLTILITTFLFFKAVVPTGSMLPTIQLKDQLIVTKVYNFNNIKRKDILVFNSKELDEKLIKRVIGLPGDKVEVKEDGSVYVNNELLDEPYVETKGGPSGTFEVPSDRYFFLGDNRPISIDSRCWAEPYISKKDILGKARFVIYPFSKIGPIK